MKRARRVSAITSSWSAPSSKPSARSSATALISVRLDSKKRAYLCNLVRPHSANGNTCQNQAWHLEWDHAGTARARASDVTSRCGRQAASRDPSAVAPQRGKSTKTPMLRLPTTEAVLTGAKTGMSRTTW
ncbi:hypothetical protein PC128_g1614 [Phytophthora cactorum]|nr:hypothetical protein PC120_g939 [Phytophthora cactorum]KAG3204929.1 hypothetical protein PC128_g1614 [Phytophthora cactorum]